jgi:hypothetical protein
MAAPSFGIQALASDWFEIGGRGDKQKCDDVGPTQRPAEQQPTMVVKATIVMQIRLRV